MPIITSALLAILSFFYIYTVAAYFKVPVNILSDSVVYLDKFAGNIISRYFDPMVVISISILWILFSVHQKRTRLVISSIYAILLIAAIVSKITILTDLTALTCLPVAVFFLVLNNKQMASSKKKSLQNTSLSLTVNYIVFIGLLTGIASIIVSVAHILSPTLSIPIENYDYEISLILSNNFSPFLVLLLIFCFPVKYLVEYIRKKVLKRRTRKKNLSHSFEPVVTSSSEVNIKNSETRRWTRVIYLAVFVFLSILLAFIPHLSTINEDNQQVGEDSNEYVDWMNALGQSRNIQEFFYSVFVDIGADRPLSLLLIYIITNIVNVSPFYNIEFLPIILGPVLVLAVYFLTRELTSNETTSLIAAFLTSAASIHTLVGIYAGLYANWIALIFGYLSLIFLFRYLKRSNTRDLILFSALVMLMQLSHVYTWSVLALVISIFLVVLIALNKIYYRKRAILLLIVVVISVVVDLLRGTLPGSTGGINQAVVITNQGILGIEQLETWWSSFILATQHKLNSIYSNFIILSLAFYWLLRSTFKVESNLFLAIFLSIGIIPVFFGNWVILSRAIYNIPLQIPAAIAITYIVKQANGNIITLAICSWLLSMSIRTLSNYYEIFPSSL